MIEAVCHDDEEMTLPRKPLWAVAYQQIMKTNACSDAPFLASPFGKGRIQEGFSLSPLLTPWVTETRTRDFLFHAMPFSGKNWQICLKTVYMEYGVT